MTIPYEQLGAAVPSAIVAGAYWRRARTLALRGSPVPRWRQIAFRALQHLLFVAFGVNVWLALLGPLPSPAWFGNLARLGYIVALRLTGTVLANVLLWSGTVFYPTYRGSELARHLSPLTDQGLAGAVMMLEESLLTIGLFAWLFMKTARDVEERQELLELAQQRGVALDERRAARAAAAGRGSELRARLETPPAAAAPLEHA